MVRTSEPVRAFEGGEGADLTLAELAAGSRTAAERAVRARAQAVYLGGDDVLARVLGRYKMLLSAKDRGFARHVMLDGYWEMWLTLFFARLVTPGMTVVDVGANYGYYTLLFADAVGPGGRVIAVEPVPDTAAALTENITLNGFAGRCELVAKALGACPEGTARMHVPFGEPKNAAVVPVDREGGIEVATTSLDAIGERLQRCDLVKIDAEGAEVDIVDGMSRLAARCGPAVLIEFNAARYPDPQRFLLRLREMFGAPALVTFDGTAQAVDDPALLGECVGEDRLLYFAARGDGRATPC